MADNVWDPTDPWKGWAEFNDADAKIRGIIIGATGTFSGEITADSVNAVREMNIRDGAVSTNLGMAYPSVGVLGRVNVDFVIPGQPFVQAVNIILPMACQMAGNNESGFVILRAYRNGVLIWEEQWSSFNLDGFTRTYTFQWYANMRFLDLDVPPSGTSVSYRFEIAWPTAMQASFFGTAFVSMRKR